MNMPVMAQTITIRSAIGLSWASAEWPTAVLMPASVEQTLPPVAAGINRDVGAHSGAQRNVAVAVREFHARGNSLNDLHPVPGLIFGRNRRKSRAARLAHRLKRALPFAAGIGVNRDIDRLSIVNVCEVRFFH